jgi:hypothetical protein
MREFQFFESIIEKNILKTGFPHLLIGETKNIFMQRLIPPPANISLKHKKKLVACRTISPTT